jgi:hypothetical protein
MGQHTDLSWPLTSAGTKLGKNVLCKNLGILNAYSIKLRFEVTRLAKLHPHLVCKQAIVRAQNKVKTSDRTYRTSWCPIWRLVWRFCVHTGDKGSQYVGSDNREHNAIAWTVALKYLQLHQSLRSIRPKLLADFFLRLAKGERFGVMVLRVITWVKQN